ncbi:NADH-quinone oxidoreductase subunit NuoN [Thiorhodospira sibirica]|uniref:NADH-quinone oxidoreductase subunit NuoN n=1 Tax=Thiorhodospira sibirica TaxID=154347 RepID=UPI00022C528A|nr:NADH-quinone oxidoreductase subunit NuoN [Thiorhodospira sibirica]
MTFELPDFSLAAAELWLLTLGCALLMLAVFVSAQRHTLLYGLSQFTLAGALGWVWWSAPESRSLTFNHHYVADDLATLLKSAVLLLTAVSLIYTRSYLERRPHLPRAEFYVLILFAVLGMFIMISAHSLLTLYLGLELLALCLYALVALNREHPPALEAAMKFFVLGALASGLLLYGMSIVYGLTGTLELHTLAAHLSDPASLPDPGSLTHLAWGFALTFLLVGLAFKLGAVPFHAWVPDVYEGAMTPVTLFIGSVSKLAALALVLRLLIEGLGALAVDWQGMLMILAVLSLTLGNLAAIAQHNLKRMLAYSTIAHIGFVTLALFAATPAGYHAALFYILVYALTAAGAFGVLLALSGEHEAQTLDDLQGLNHHHPWLAFLMLVLMASMAGLPPLLGFYAKLIVLQALLDQGHLALALYAVIFSVIGAFYYLRVIKRMYFDTPTHAATPRPARDLTLALSLNGLLLIALGLLPGLLLALTHAVF